ncbi:MAG: hypothetical protein V1492_01875 [Candidatus Micrarchaeota archaeon]
MADSFNGLYVGISTDKLTSNTFLQLINEAAARGDFGALAVAFTTCPNEKDKKTIEDRLLIAFDVCRDEGRLEEIRPYLSRKGMSFRALARAHKEFQSNGEKKLLEQNMVGSIDSCSESFLDGVSAALKPLSHVSNKVIMAAGRAFERTNRSFALEELLARMDLENATRENLENMLLNSIDSHVQKGEKTFVGQVVDRQPRLQFGTKAALVAARDEAVINSQKLGRGNPLQGDGVQCKPDRTLIHKFRELIARIKTPGKKQSL